MIPPGASGAGGVVLPRPPLLRRNRARFPLERGGVYGAGEAASGQKNLLVPPIVKPGRAARGPKPPSGRPPGE